LNYLSSSNGLISYEEIKISATNGSDVYQFTPSRAISNNDNVTITISRISSEYRSNYCNEPVFP